MAATNVQAFSGDVEVVGKLTASGSEAPIRWNSANETAFPQNDGQKYWKIATLGTTSGTSNFGELRIKGIIGGATSEKLTGINASIVTRGGLSVYGNLEGYGVGLEGPNNYTDIVVYEETGGAFTVYLKTNSYFKFDIILLGGTTDSFNTIQVFPCPTTSGTNVTPTGTLVTASVIDECSVVFADNGNVGIGKTDPDRKLHVYTAAGEGNTQLQLESADRYSSTVMLDDTGAILYGNDRGAMRFLTGYDTSLVGGSEAMRIDTNGYVGIGTNDPAQVLDVRGGNIRVDGTGERIIENKNDTSDYGTLTLASGYRGGSSRPKIQIHGYKGTNTVHGDNIIEFHTAGSSRMKINQSGSVGIGNDTPDGGLNVQASHFSRIGLMTVYHGSSFVAGSNSTHYGTGINLYSTGGGGGLIFLTAHNDNVGTRVSFYLIWFCRHYNTVNNWNSYKPYGFVVARSSNSPTIDSVIQDNGTLKFSYNENNVNVRWFAITL